MPKTHLIGMLFLLSVMGAGPATQPATRPILGVTQILKELPKDYYPPAGRQWDELFVQKANGWMKEHIDEKTMTIAGEFLAADVVHGDTFAELMVPDVIKPPFKYQIFVSDKFSPDGAKSLEKLRKGQRVSVRGKVKAARFQEVQSNNDVWLQIDLVDCAVVK